VVRCEFEREGVVVPPGARFMGRSPVDALRIFDYTAWPLAAVQAHFRHDWISIDTKTPMKRAYHRAALKYTPKYTPTEQSRQRFTR
jgi:hypothetical protein